MLSGEGLADEKGDVLLPWLKDALQELISKRRALRKKSPLIEIKSNGCWQWAWSLDKDGYGEFLCNNQRLRMHRYFYEKLKKPIPDGLTIDHLCRNRACCNPSHLEAVTLKENLLRGDTLNAKYAQRTHCKQGHELTAENLAKNHKGHFGRNCLKCIKLRQANRQERKNL